jgi:triacylglycerol lipase
LGSSYWGRIPKYFRQNGVVFFYGGTDAWGTIESNAALLKERILSLQRERNIEKFHIIAHSRGGLEARYLISALGMSAAAASLTTISTPHHGAKIMNMTHRIPDPLYRFVSFFVDLWNRICGDKNPDFFTCSRQLSALSCGAFNRAYPNAETVYYQSYTARLKYFFSDPLFLLLCLLLRITDGDSDGLCPVESAKWGNYRGVISTQGIFGISHAGVVDFYRVKYKGMDIPQLFLNIAKELTSAEGSREPR